MCGGRVLHEGPKGGDKVGRTRAGKASKRHLIAEGGGRPVAAYPAARPSADITAAPEVLAQLKVPRKRGRPRMRPDGPAADPRPRRQRVSPLSLVPRGSRHSIPTRRAPSQGKLKYRPRTHRKLSGNRSMVKRLLAGFNGFRRLSQRLERYAFSPRLFSIWPTPGFASRDF